VFCRIASTEEPVQLYHLTLSTRRREPIARDLESRRAVLRALARVAGRQAVLFCLVDDHLHLVVEGDRRVAGARASGLTRALGTMVTARTDGFHIRPVEGRSHLEWLVGYVLTQTTRHGLAEHPALYEGSCFQDLVGARLLKGFQGSMLWRWLPRWTPARLCRIVDVASTRPVTDRELTRVSLDQILTAARAALCTELSGRRPPAVRARRAAVGLATLAGFRSADAARALGCTPRAVQSLRHSPDAEAEGAVRHRIGLELATASPSRHDERNAVPAALV